MTSTIVAIAAIVCGIITLAAPQFTRWAVGVWLIIYGTFVLFPH